VAELARGERGLDAFGDMKDVADRVELDGGAVDDAEHAAADLLAVSRERDTLHGRDLVVVDRAEGRDERRHADGGAAVFVAPGAARVIAQHAAGHVVGQGELARR
jgi:hypothetical protein